VGKNAYESWVDPRLVGIVEVEEKSWLDMLQRLRKGRINATSIEEILRVRDQEIQEFIEPMSSICCDSWCAIGSRIWSNRVKKKKKRRTMIRLASSRFNLLGQEYKVTIYTNALLILVFDLHSL
jgi:hypothetical protein